MHNGQGDGDTESGSYTLLGGTVRPSNWKTLTRNEGALWALPSHDEWHKAAYYDPRTEAEGGPPGDTHYWLYPTRSNTDPTRATATTTGDISNPGANVANYLRGADWNGQDGNLTTVGSAGPLSASYYQTLDQAGNVWEIIEEPQMLGEDVDAMIFRGGGWRASVIFLDATSGGAGISPGHYGWEDVGFRMVVVPEPSTLILAVLGLAVAAVRAATRSKQRAGSRGLAPSQPAAL